MTDNQPPQPIIYDESGTVDESLWQKLSTARYVIWFCPNRVDDLHEGPDAVEWTTGEDGKMTPHCRICGVKGTAR